MTRSVTRNVQHLKTQSKQLDGIAVGQAGQGFWYGLMHWPEDPGTCGVAQGIHTPGMIPMVMGDKNAVELYGQLIKRAENDRGITRINHQGAHAVVQHPDIVVVESR